MKIIEITHEDKEKLCSELKKANEAIESLIFKLKETEAESDSRMWRAEGDYRSHEDPYYSKRYRDDFRYRG